MNWDQIEGKWKQYAGNAKEKWGKLTDNDLEVVRGKRDQLVGKIQERYGIMKQEAEKQVDEFVSSFASAGSTQEAKDDERRRNASDSSKKKGHAVGKS